MNIPSPPASPSEEVAAAAAQIEALLAHFEAHTDTATHEAVLSLLNAVDLLHRTGVTRLYQEVVALGADEAELAGDPLLAPLLELYGLLPLDEQEQVEEALESVRPYIHSHGGEVEVLEIADGVVHVRLSGACHGCSGSAITLKRGVEEALRQGYRTFQRLEVHEPEAPPAPAGFVSLEQLRSSAEKLRRPIWSDIAPLEQVPTGSVRRFEVEGISLLLCNIAGEVYGFRNRCTHCDLPLDEAKLSGPVLVCPFQNCAYDARSGRRVDGEEGRLDVYPIALANGMIRLALNVPGAAR